MSLGMSEFRFSPRLEALPIVDAVYEGLFGFLTVPWLGPVERVEEGYQLFLFILVVAPSPKKKRVSGRAPS